MGVYAVVVSWHSFGSDLAAAGSAIASVDWPSAPPEKLYSMPAIARFYGIVIAMFFNDHAPPHFHARYGEHRGRVSIETGKPLDGDLPARALRLIEEWCSLHRDELRANWEHAERLEPLAPIDPLP